jgi:predicted dehydrogenase
MSKLLLATVVITCCASCVMKTIESSGDRKSVQLITLDPGHFHAALIQKSGYPDVDSTVYVYAPAGNDVNFHLDRVKAYNSRKDSPTNWNEVIYTGEDFFQRMISEKPGNVVVISGNNKKKTEYILGALQNNLHVLADKPMVINTDGFHKLKEAFAVAEKNKVLLYDIMTERFEITSILQRELSRIPEVFGTLEKGTPDNPAITKESVHHFYKYVSGNVLTRPAWFLDANQQGEGIVDVMTHLVDLVQWECFPDQALDTTEIQINSAKRWATEISLSQFKEITKQESFPDFLQSNVTDSILKVFCNGKINYQVRGIHARTSVIWKYKAPEGTADTHYSIMRGTRANLVIKQGAEENYKPALYIEPVGNGDIDAELRQHFEALVSHYPGIALKKVDKGWEVTIPDEYKQGHEAHFAQVTENFLRYLKHGKMPDWEVPNMLAKYYTTTKALEVALMK